MTQLKQGIRDEIPYAPNYTVKPDGVLSIRLDSIDRLRWQFDNLIIDPDYKAWFQERAVIRRVHSSTTIEGNRIGEDDTARLLRGEDVDAEEGQKLEVLNLKRAMDFVDHVAADATIPIDEQVVRELHYIIMMGTDALLTPGQYRRGQNKVRNPMTGGIAYVPPDAGDVPGLMRQFSLWLRQDHDPKLAPLVAGIAHLHLVEVHPFWDGNGRTTRALEALILARYGFDFNRLLSPERQFAWELKRYFENIGSTVGPSYAEGRDLTAWLDYFLLSLTVEIDQVSSWLVDFRRFMESFHRSMKPLGLTKRQVDILAYVHVNGSLAPKDYEKLFGKSGMTARRDLSKLVDVGALVAAGNTRSRRYLYHPTDEFLSAIGQPDAQERGVPPPAR